MKPECGNSEHFKKKELALCSVVEDIPLTTSKCVCVCVCVCVGLYTPSVFSTICNVQTLTPFSLGLYEYCKYESNNIV